MSVITIDDRDLMDKLYSCSYCDRELARIWMRGYATGHEDIALCRDCAMQLVRKLTEDLCEFTKGGRNG